VAQVSPADTSVPTATPDPAATRNVAAAAYAAAADKYRKDIAALNKKYPSGSTLKRVRAYYAAGSKIEGAFLAAIRKIVVPPDTTSSMRDLVVKTTALQALDVEGSKVKTWADFNDVRAAAKKADRAASAAANLVRSDLGLPPVK
jgi:hypothetical protein